MLHLSSSILTAVFLAFVDNMIGFWRCIKQICVFVQRPFDVLHTIPAMFTSSCQLLPHLRNLSPFLSNIYPCMMKTD